MVGIKNKRGFRTISLIMLIFVSFFLIIILGVISYSAQLTDNAISSFDFNIGNQSFNDTYAQTLKPAFTALKTTVPSLLGIGTMLGMIIALGLVGYFTPHINRAWLILDIFIICIAFALGIVIQESFTTYMNSNSDLLLVYANNLPLPAKFVLALEVIIPVVGVIIMILTYAVRKEEKVLPQEEALGY